MSRLVLIGVGVVVVGALVIGGVWGGKMLLERASTGGSAVVTERQQNNSDSQIDADLNDLGAKMNAVDQEQVNVDSGINQQAPSLGQQ